MGHRSRLGSWCVVLLAVCALTCTAQRVSAGAPHDAGVAEKVKSPPAQKKKVPEKKKAPVGGENKPSPAQPCASDASCGAGEHCSTRDGACLPPPDCQPGEMCAEVCYGTCVPDKAAPQASRCEADGACRVRANYCGGCRCEAVLTGAPVTPCTGPTAACLADPCAKQKAICQQGTCALAPL